MGYALGIGVMLSVKVLCSLYRWNAIDLYMLQDKREVCATRYKKEHETRYKKEKWNMLYESKYVKLYEIMHVVCNLFLFCV